LSFGGLKNGTNSTVTTDMYSPSCFVRRSDFGGGGVGGGSTNGRWKKGHEQIAQTQFLGTRSHFFVCPTTDLEKKCISENFMTFQCGLENVSNNPNVEGFYVGFRMSST
jgi:hypothetical protein